MLNWNRFVRETLQKEQGKPNKDGEKITVINKLTSKKGNIERREDR